mgnify:CR=1 FL=1
MKLFVADYHKESEPYFIYELKKVGLRDSQWDISYSISFARKLYPCYLGRSRALMVCRLRINRTCPHFSKNLA